MTLTYNPLNLPSQATGNNKIVGFVYDAEGVKLRKVVTSGGTTSVREYIDGIEYNGSVIDVIHTEEGVAQNNGNQTYSYHYNLKDHLGNVRRTFDIYNGQVRPLQTDDYFAFGKRNSQAYGNNKYLYNGKEIQDELGEQYDYGARFYDPVIGRFHVVDRYAEKYYSWNPYQYALNNPSNNIDINGDSVYVAKEHRETMNEALKALYGENASKFSYNDNGMLTYTGDTKGFTKEQSALYKGLSGVMSEKTITNVVFGESATITMKDGKTEVVKASTGGGAVTVLVGENNVTQNTILIDPKTANNTLSVYAVTDAYYKTPIDPANGPRFVQKIIQNNLGTSTAHELGHVIYRGQSQDKVLDYDNKARKQMGLPKRPFDETHNFTVKKGQYGN